MKHWKAAAADRRIGHERKKRY